MKKERFAVFMFTALILVAIIAGLQGENEEHEITVEVLGMAGTPSSPVDSRTIEWYVRTVDSKGTVGKWTSLALDSGGAPHVSYADVTRDDLKYAHHKDTQWHVETVDSRGHVGKYTSLALDSDDHAHISYYDGSNRDLKYAYFDGASWNNEVVDSAGSVGKYTALALDSKDLPHISYYDETNGDLKYARYDGIKWLIESVDSDANVGEFSSLVLDIEGRPHVSYMDASGTTLRYARLTGADWEIMTVDSDGEVGEWTSIALGASDSVHVSYRDMAGKSLKYAVYNGTKWSVETVDSDGDVGRFTSISLQPEGTVHISYHDYSRNDIKYARLNDSGWMTRTVDENGDRYTSLDLDVHNRPHMSYFDEGNGDLKFAVVDDEMTVHDPEPDPDDSTGSDVDTHTVYADLTDATTVVKKSVNPGDTVTFKVKQGLEQTDRDAFQWTIDLEEGPKVLTGIEVNHTFGIMGVYGVNLSVTDPQDTVQKYPLSITVKDMRPPVITAYMNGKKLKNDGKYDVPECKFVKFDASESTDNIGIASYRWSFDDEEGEMEWDTDTVSQKMTKCSTIVLTVTDEEGNEAEAVYKIKITGKFTPRNLPSWLQAIILLFVLGLLVISILI